MNTINTAVYNKVNMQINMTTKHSNLLSPVLSENCTIHATQHIILAAMLQLHPCKKDNAPFSDICIFYELISDDRFT